MRRGSGMRLRRGGRPLRPMDWGGSSNPGFSLPAFSSTGIYIFPPSSVRGDFVDPTVMRMILAWGVSSLVDTGGTLAVGCGIIAWDDVDDTPDGVPNVVDNINLDWMYGDYQWFQNRLTSGAVSASARSAGGSDTGIVDIASRRRLGNTKGLLLTFVNDGDQAAIVSFWVRYLIKE